MANPRAIAPVAGAPEQELGRKVTGATDRPQARPEIRVQHLLEIPSDLPGSKAPPIQIPPFRPGKEDPARQSAIEELYQALPGLESLPKARPAEDGRPWTLEVLQEMAVERSPLVGQAAADVEAARGNAIQAGTYFNPHLAYEGDNINSGGTGGFQGVNVTQTFDVGGRLRLARAAACVDMENAKLVLRRTHYELASQVRSNYFAALVAQEKVKVNRALVALADGVYRTQIARVRAGQAAPYEPLQLRVLSVQARAQLVQVQNDYTAAWRRLAATLNAPETPPTELAGSVDGPVPEILYEPARDHLLASHTNLAIARNGVNKARLQLELARVTGSVPNLDTGFTVQKDHTTFPFTTAYNVQLGAALPIFDRNRGGIIAAEAALVRADQERDRARNELLGSLADAFSRYRTASTTARYYRDQILSDQVRAYRAMYERYQEEPDRVDFNDLVTAQQTLATTVSSYLQALGDQWQAVVDVAGLLQADELFLVGGGEPAESPAAK